MGITTLRKVLSGGHLHDSRLVGISECGMISSTSTDVCMDLPNTGVVALTSHPIGAGLLLERRLNFRLPSGSTAVEESARIGVAAFTSHPGGAELLFESRLNFARSASTALEESTRSVMGVAGAKLLLVPQRCAICCCRCCGCCCCCCSSLGLPICTGALLLLLLPPSCGEAVAAEFCLLCASLGEISLPASGCGESDLRL